MKPYLYRAIIAAFALWLITPQQTVKAGASRCAHLIAKNYREFVFNYCNSCRRVGIRRRRIGTRNAPVMRIYDLQPNSKFSLPFKGPGRSRVTSDVPCRDKAGVGRDIINPGKGQRAKQPQTCVSWQNNGTLGITLVNNCGKCRAVALARYSRSGKPIGRHFYKLNPHKNMRILPKGGARISYLTDFTCPS